MHGADRGRGCKGERMAKEYVPIFFEWLDVTQDLTAEEKGNLIDAVVSYASGREYEHLLMGACKIAFRFLKGQVDRNAAISDVRRQARQGKTSSDNKPQQNTINDNKTGQTESNLPKEKEKEKDKDKDKKREPQKRFTPPTTAEVADYCKGRNNGIDPEYFVNYYAARGWELKPGQKVKDWRACVRTWEMHDKERGRANGNGSGAGYAAAGAANGGTGSKYAFLDTDSL